MVDRDDVDILVAIDKFRGTASSLDLGDAIAEVAADEGLRVDLQNMSDGGEGFLNVFTGEVVVVDVPGPLGESVSARVKLVHSDTGMVGVIEVADVVGRDVLSSPRGDEALRASSEGVGHLIAAAEDLDVRHVLVGCGGSATSDGGLGCYRVLAERGTPLVPVTVATDVTTRFLAARAFATQKGVRDSDLTVVDHRLRDARALYLAERGVDVETLEGTGAAGGIPGALAALGASITSGIELVIDTVELRRRCARASMVVTGEGRFDGGSLAGKVPVGVAAAAGDATPILLVCGSIELEAATAFQRQFPNATVVSLEERFGLERAVRDVLSCVATVVRAAVRRNVAPG
jgi:glycerate kinase